MKMTKSFHKGIEMTICLSKRKMTPHQYLFKNDKMFNDQKGKWLNNNNDVKMTKF